MNMFGHLLLVVSVVIILTLISLDLLVMITSVIVIHFCGRLSSSVIIKIPHGSSKCCLLQLTTLQ